MPDVWYATEIAPRVQQQIAANNAAQWDRILNLIQLSLTQETWGMDVMNRQRLWMRAAKLEQSD